MKAFVRECTDLPVTLVLTHGHVDHAGASFEYGECYVNPADVALLYEHGDIDKRYGFVMGGGKQRCYRGSSEEFSYENVNLYKGNCVERIVGMYSLYSIQPCLTTRLGKRC